MLTTRGLKGSLQAIEKQVKEFLSILLLSGVGGSAIELLEGEAEILRVEGLALRKLQASGQFLKLVHHVVIDLITLVVDYICWLAIIDTEKIVAEGGSHEELLHHGVHVADAAEVNETNIFLLGGRVRGCRRLIIPRLRLLDRSDQGLKVLS